MACVAEVVNRSLKADGTDFTYHFTMEVPPPPRGGLTIRTKVVMIQQKYETITEVNYRADTKRFTHRRCKKLTSCQFLDDAKNNINMSKILVYFNYLLNEVLNHSIKILRDQNINRSNVIPGGWGT